MTITNTVKWPLQVIRLLILFTVGASNLSYGKIPYKFESTSPVYVIGHIHGAYQQVSDTLARLDLIDSEQNWKAGNTHIVSLGDLLGGESVSTKIMDFFIQLQQQAELAGGRFHILLGDQEIEYLLSSLANNPAGLSDKYRQWLIGLPFVVQINDQVFAHGGLSKKLAKLEITELNHSLKTSLIDYLARWNAITSDYQSLNGLAFSKHFDAVAKLEKTQQLNQFLEMEKQLLFSNDNPALYRGNAICHPYFETENLSGILNHWSATRLWTGHSSNSGHQLNSRLNKLLMVMDTRLSDTGEGTEYWVAKIENANEPLFFNVYTKEQLPVKPATKRKTYIPYGMTEIEVEVFLKTAEIIKREDLNVGITKPIKMTLKKADRSMTAVFKYVDSNPKKERGRWKKEIYEDDRFFYDIAAYKLDRMLGIGLVPVVVERTIDHKKGILQLWIDGLISKKSQKEQKIAYGGHCNFRDQINMLDTFDYLIRNNDRNQSNILYSKNDWQIWFIDHSRSFGLSDSRPKMMKKHTIKVTKYFKDALQSLTKEKLYTLKPWLHRKQINAIWDRRRKMLKDKF